MKAKTRKAVREFKEALKEAWELGNKASELLMEDDLYIDEEAERDMIEEILSFLADYQEQVEE